MASSFTWLDASENDRRRAMEVIDLFRRQGTLDELGIGTVRDALADLLSPGISTIQTRARYFLIVPWVYLRLERKKIPSTEIARRGREDELWVAEALARSADTEGAIGIEAGRALQRLPSAVYWGGLGALGVRLFRGSQDQYHRSLDRFYSAGARAASLREDREAEFLGGSNWHPHIPDAPEKFRDELGFALTEAEARYLQDRLQARAPGSLVAFLAQRQAPFERTRFSWDEELLSTYPEPLRTWVEHARCFSEAMHGAALLYNLMLAEARKHEGWMADYEGRLAQWQAMMGDRAAALAAWDRRAFWALVTGGESRIPIGTRHFVSRWLGFAIDGVSLEVGTPAQRRLIFEREATLKRGRARLLHPEYLQMWGGAAGTDPLDYRWGTTEAVANDILHGLYGAKPGVGAA
jgi:Family of unknown function (DUF6361)